MMKKGWESTMNEMTGKGGPPRKQFKMEDYTDYEFIANEANDQLDEYDSVDVWTPESQPEEVSACFKKFFDC